MENFTSILGIWLNCLKSIMWIPWTDSLVDYFFEYLKSKTVLDTLWPINVRPWKMFLLYLYNTYFKPTAMFHYKKWNHFDQLLTYGDPDMTTNSSESINSVLNRNCSSLKTKNSVFLKILKNKEQHLEKFWFIVKLDHLSEAQQPKRTTEKFEILHDLCEAFDNFSGSERQDNLFKYLGLFARRDPIPVGCSDECSDECSNDSETASE